MTLQQRLAVELPIIQAPMAGAQGSGQPFNVNFFLSCATDARPRP
jgi:hypothetical protein